MARRAADQPRDQEAGRHLGEAGTVGSWGQQRAEMDIARKTEIAPASLNATELADSYRDQRTSIARVWHRPLALKLGDATLLLPVRNTPPTAG